jgi:protein-S-isoprenylcysteine O-methyltransferase Ste14
MLSITYILYAATLLVAAYSVFRKIVRKDYLEHGRLKWSSSLLQLLIFFGLMCFPYVYNPIEWQFFWEIDITSDPGYVLAGFTLIILGFAVAFGTMFWFGLGRAFGVKTSGIIQSGPYRYSRNPQILGGYLLVIGISMQWPSLYSFGWVILYGVVSHMMILTEEEYLSKQYREAYTQYCKEVPRYLLLRKRG